MWAPLLSGSESHSICIVIQLDCEIDLFFGKQSTISHSITWSQRILDTPCSFSLLGKLKDKGSRIVADISYSQDNIQGLDVLSQTSNEISRRRFQAHPFARKPAPLFQPSTLAESGLEAAEALNAHFPTRRLTFS